MNVMCASQIGKWKGIKLLQNNENFDGIDLACAFGVAS